MAQGHKTYSVECKGFHLLHHFPTPHERPTPAMKTETGITSSLRHRALCSLLLLTFTTQLVPAATVETITRTYDALGQLRTEKNGVGNTTTYNNYDGNGNLLSVTDPLGRTSTYTYDNLDRPKTDLQADTSGFVNTWDNTTGDLKTVEDRNQHRQNGYQYDGFHAVTQVTNPDGGTFKYTYYADGRIQSLTDARTLTQTYTYDKLGRILSRVYRGGLSVTYTWDNTRIGSLGRISSNGVQLDYGYDTQGHVKTVTQTIGT